MTETILPQEPGKTPCPFEQPALTITEFNQLCINQRHHQPFQVAVWLFLTKTPEELKQLVFNDGACSLDLEQEISSLNEFLADSLVHSREALLRLRWGLREAKL